MRCTRVDSVPIPYGVCFLLAFFSLPTTWVTFVVMRQAVPETVSAIHCDKWQERNADGLYVLHRLAGSDCGSSCATHCHTMADIPDEVKIT
jgi:hypothetical protein